MQKSPSYNDFLAEFPAKKKDESYEVYCHTYFGVTAYERVGKKLTGKTGNELLANVSPSLISAWNRFSSTQTECDWASLYDSMPYLFYTSLFPRRLDVYDQVGSDAPWEGGEG